MTALSWTVMLATAVASAPVAQQSVNPDAAIEIIGKAPPQIRREATDYVHELGVASGNKPAGRWLDPVCPRAIGLDPEKSAVVEQQVRTVAQTVGAPIARTKCDPNLLLVFTDDAKGVVKSVFRKLQSSGLIADRTALETGDYPVRWWYSSDIRTRDNMPPGVVSPALRVETESSSGILSGGLQANENARSITQPGSSIVSTQLKRALTHATVVIDVHGVTGKSLESLVDYAAFVGLTEVRLGATAPNSILGLFGSAPNIGELTVTDRAFLTALYSLNLDRRAEQHRRVLIGQIIRERTKSN